MPASHGSLTVLALSGALSATLAFAVGCDSSPPDPDPGPVLADAGSDAGSVDAGAREPFVGPTGTTAGCGGAAPETGVVTRTIDVGGETRSYVRVVPDDYSADRDYALVFAWHGLGDRGDRFQAALRFEETTGGEAIVVYPQASTPVLGSIGWDLANEGVDVALFDAILAETSAELCIERGRVFSMGFSHGGFMSHTLGCRRGDVIRAIAPIAASASGGSCVGQVAVWMTHGDADRVVNISLGERARDTWRRRNWCQLDTEPASPSSCVSFVGCDAEYPTHWCPTAEAHTVPSFAPAALWAFFDGL